MLIILTLFTSTYYVPDKVPSPSQTLPHLIPQQPYKEILSLFLFHIQSIIIIRGSVQFSRSVMSDSSPWTAAHQASLSITNSQSLLKLMPIKSVMPSSHLILCHPLLLLPPIPPSIRVFSNESVLHIRWPKYWEFKLQHQSFQ